MRGSKESQTSHGILCRCLEPVPRICFTRQGGMSGTQEYGRSWGPAAKRFGTDRSMNEIMPPLKSLRAFEAAARHESFLNAATELHVSTGAISRHIKLLEEFLGARLFDRRSNGVVLTPDGRRYASRVTKFFSDLTSATADIKPLGKSRRLIISTLPVFSERWLNRRLSTFLQRCPGTSLQIEFHDGVQGLLVGDVDAWILYSDGIHPGCNVPPLVRRRACPRLQPEASTNPTGASEGGTGRGTTISP